MKRINQAWKEIKHLKLFPIIQSLDIDEETKNKALDDINFVFKTGNYHKDADSIFTAFSWELTKRGPLFWHDLFVRSGRKM